MNIHNMPIIVVVTYFSFVFLFSFFRGKKIRNHQLFLFRSLLPNWRFFEDVIPVPLLYVRYQINSHAKMSDWILCLDKSNRKFSAFFLNPQGNINLTYNSLLELMVTELFELENLDEQSLLKFQKTTSYLQVQRLVENQLQKKIKDINIKNINYQFKIASATPGLNPQPPEDILMSPIYDNSNAGIIDNDADNDADNDDKNDDRKNLDLNSFSKILITEKVVNSAPEIELSLPLETFNKDNDNDNDKNSNSTDTLISEQKRLELDATI